MSVTKTIKLYEILTHPSINYNGLTENNSGNETYHKFVSAFKNGEDYYSIKINDKSYFFEVLVMDQEKMYAKCSVENKIGYTSFVQQRSREAQESHPFTTADIESQLEYYTFFYIDFSLNKMAILYSKYVQRINDVLSEFIYTKSGNVENVDIIPVRAENINERSKNFNNMFRELTLRFANPIENETPSLIHSLEADIDIESYELNLKLKKTKNGQNLIENLKTLKDGNKNIDAMKLHGTNNDGVNDVLDFFESAYTKAVPIGLTEDTATNTEYIKNILASSISNLAVKSNQH